MTAYVITLTPVSMEDEPLLSAWFDADPEGSKHMVFYRDVRAWLRLLSMDRHGWIAYALGRPIGFLDLETDGRTGYFSYYVALAYRRQGYGRSLLSALDLRCQDMGIDRAVGSVEPENTASLEALRRVGFTVSDHPDAEGMLTASKSLTSA